MRLALIGVISIGGCASPASDPMAVDVLVSPQGVGYYISPGTTCTCHAIETFPSTSGCTQSSDAGPACTCYPGACLTSVSAYSGTSVIAGAPHASQEVTGGVTGDFTQPDLSLVFRGCGDDVVLALTPDFPVAVSYSVSSDQTQVSWALVTNDGFLVRTDTPYYGELCRTERNVSSQQLHENFAELSVRTLRGPTSIMLGDFTFSVWSTN